jgi:glyoxylase-like metal-dependent hydrolase (beta-lactamase superfamily II)
VIRIVRVLAPNPGVYTLEGTNTWVVGEAPTVVIDPGPDDDAHLAEVAATAGLVAAVLVTHDHEDHAEGARRFADRVGAPLRSWRLQGAEHLRDGEIVRGGGVELRAVHAPGHSADHLCFFVSAEAALFTGDTVLGRGTSFLDPPDGDLTKYLASLERLRDLAPRTIYPGHGPVLLDGTAALAGYLEHRQERERQVLAELAGGPRTVDALVAAIYETYPQEVRPLAARSMTAHLRKLENEGRAEGKGRGSARAWTLAEPKACARCGRPVRGRARYCSSCSVILLQEAAPEPTAPEAAAPEA